MQLAEPLAAFTGDTAAFNAEPELLDDCLQAQYASPQRGWSPRTVLVLLLLAGLLLSWIGLAWHERAKRADTVSLFRAEPGYIVTRTDVENGQLMIEGLRDPLARAPRELFEDAPLSSIEVALQLAHTTTEGFVMCCYRKRLYCTLEFNFIECFHP